MPFSDILGTIGNTPLVELRNVSPNPRVRIFAKLEGQNPGGSLKDRIAHYMIKAAEESGELTHDRIILEATSGNTGIGLAMIGIVKGYEVKVVMPDNLSPERTRLLRAFGADIVYSDGARGTNGAIVMALAMAAEDRRYYMPFQFGNENNPRAHYETTGSEIVRDLPDLDVFVAGLGTGGTLTGVGRRLKEHNPNIRVVATLPPVGDLVQGLRSLDEGFIPPVLDQSLLDDRLEVDSRTACAAANGLLQKEGVFAGVSSGAALCAAQRVAQEMDEGKIVVLLADGGWKYLSMPLDEGL
jgi:cysteine synthase B